MNYYISQMRDYLRNYFKTEMKYEQQRQDAKRRYSPEYASSELAKITQQSNNSYSYYQNAIIDMFSEIRELLSVADFPDPSRIPDHLKELFSVTSPIRLTHDEVKRVISEHSANFSVQRMISDWLQQKRQAGQLKAKHTGSVFIDEFADCHPVSPIDQLIIYKRFSDSALDVLNKIHYAPQNVSEFEVTMFGDESFAVGLYSIVGDGISLKKYKDSPYFESAKNSFDSVALNV